MDKYLQAEYIFNKLNAAGAGLGNVSILIIKKALQDLEAAEQLHEADGGCPLSASIQEALNSGDGTYRP